MYDRSQTSDRAKEKKRLKFCTTRNILCGGREDLVGICCVMVVKALEQRYGSQLSVMLHTRMLLFSSKIEQDLLVR